ncbi:MAG: MBL fold metallo-hydrolase [Candidatus Odinarchaeota archaeon]
MNLIEVTDSVVVCQDTSYYLVNMVCVHLGDELVFIDTSTKSKLANQFRRDMEEKYGTDKATLVITHANNDHFRAVNAFSDLPVVVSKLFNERVKQYSLPTSARKILQQARTFSEELVFGSGNNQLFFRLTGGHTPDSIYGFFPRDKVVIAGDNLISDMPQYFLFPDTDLNLWIDCLKSWEQLAADKFICGHGGIVGKDHVINVRTYFENLRQFLVNSLEKKLAIEDVLSHPELPEYFEGDPDGWLEKGIYQCYENTRKV